MSEEKDYEIEDLRFAKSLIKHGYVSANPESLAKVIRAIKDKPISEDKKIDIIDLFLQNK